MFSIGSCPLISDRSICRLGLVTALLKHLATGGGVCCLVADQHWTDGANIAKKMVETACAQNELSLIAKDVSWLWRAAYNCAIEGCMAWEQSESQISDLFDVSREVSRAVKYICSEVEYRPPQLLELYCEGTPTAVDTDLHHHIVVASFAAVTGRGKSHLHWLPTLLSVPHKVTS